MANETKITSVTAPIGGQYFVVIRQAVSSEFIEELQHDGVSRGTIEAIKQDNQGRETVPVGGAAIPPSDGSTHG